MMLSDSRIVEIHFTNEQVAKLKPLYDAWREGSQYAGILMQAFETTARARLVTVNQSGLISVTLTGYRCQRQRPQLMIQPRRNQPLNPPTHPHEIAAYEDARIEPA